MTGRGRTIAHIGIIAAACMLVMGRQLLEPGVYSCLMEDTVYYLNWVRQAADSMASGVIYPRWMPDSHAGYGNPVFVYYPPLATFSAAAVLLATGDIVFSVTLVKAAAMLLSGLFMYLFLQKLYSSRAAVTGAVLYMFMPYRVYEMYFLGIHSFKLCYVWFPLILYNLHGIIHSERKARDVALLGISFGLLCLTHLLAAYLFVFVMAFYILIVCDSGHRLSCSAYAAGGVMLGLALAGIYVIPALLEDGYVHFDVLTTRESFLYFRNFLFNSGGGHAYWFYGYLSMTVITTAGIGLALMLTGWPAGRDTGGRAMYALVLGFLLSLFMMTAMSRPLWDYVPGMKLVQFPTRWSVLLVFCSAGLAAAGVNGCTKHRMAAGRAMAAVFAAIFALWGGWYVYDSVSRGCACTGQDMAGLPSDMDVYEYVPAGVSLGWLENVSETGISGRISLKNPGKNVKLTVMEWSPEHRVIAYDGEDGGVIRLRAFNYPGWRAFAGGSELAIRTEPVSGAILIDAPAGRYDIRVMLTETPTRRAARLLTIAGVAIAAVLIYKETRRRKTSK